MRIKLVATMKVTTSMPSIDVIGDGVYETFRGKKVTDPSAFSDSEMRSSVEC